MLDRYDVRLDLDRRTGELPPVDQARLAIVRAAEDLNRYRTRSGYKHSVLVLDEPTVFLPEEDVEQLFDLIRTVEAEGAAVLFISHDLVAVRSIADRVVVLRDGRVVAEVPAGEIEEQALVDLIVGTSARQGGSAAADEARPVEVTAGRAAGRAGAEDTPGPGPGEHVAVEHLTDERLHDLSFEIGAGEILGVAGLIGSGAEDLPYLLFGAHPDRSAARCASVPRPSTSRAQPGSAACGSASPSSPRTAAAGAEPRRLTLWENIVMLVEDEHYRGGVFHRGELVELAREAVDRFLIRPPQTRSRHVDVLRRQPAEGTAREVADRPAAAAAAARADAGRRRRRQAGHLPVREISRHPESDVGAVGDDGLR